MTAFAVAATALTLTLTGLAITASALTDHGLRRLRSHGPHAKKIGGAVLVAIGAWFAYLAIADPTHLLP